MKRLLKTSMVAVALAAVVLPVSAFGVRVELRAPASWFARIGSTIEFRLLASSLLSLKVPGPVWLDSATGTGDTGGSGGGSGGQTSGDDGTSGEGESGFVDR